MKKLFLLFIIPSLCTAQESELYGKIFPAKVLYFSSPQVHEVQMRYENPLYFSNRNSEFLIDDKNIKCELIEAFTADRYNWTRKLDPNPTLGGSVVDALAGKDEHITMARLGIQGAIEDYSVFQKGIGGGTIETPYIRKTNGKAYNATIWEAETQIREWIADSPEISRELKSADSLVASNNAKIAILKKNDSLAKVQNEQDAKRKGLVGWAKNADDEKKLKNDIALVGHTRVQWLIIVNNYNVWYNQKFPGKIKYYFEDPQTRYPSQLESHIERENRINVKSAAQIEKESYQKKQAELYANRSTSVSAEYASAKNNEPVKKETFSAKLDRIKADGNKIGIIFTLNPVRSKPKASQNAPGSSSMMNSSLGEDIYIEGEYLDESLQFLGKEFAEELNKVMGRTDIELIDLKNMPYRDARVFGIDTRIDNCWATKYKLVFAYTIDPIIEAQHETMTGKNKFEATLKFGSSVIVHEYIGGPESKEKDLITQMLSMGAFNSQKLVQDEDIKTIKEVYEKLLEKMNPVFTEKIKTERAPDVQKLVEKKLK